MKKYRLLRLVIAAAALILVSAGLCFGESAEVEFQRHAAEGGVRLECSCPVSGVYLIFDKEPGSYTVNGVSAPHPYFLHNFISVDAAQTIEISGAVPAEIHLFAGTDLPSWVQVWEEPEGRADLLLISSHADDEQLFFAGLLPYYTQVRGLEVQVAYATDHDNQPERHHERLNGLWAVGVRRYPVSSGYADLYSESYDQALANLAPYGVTEQDVLNWEAELLRRFEPQVLVTHDSNGEYGHGMHKLISGTVQRVLENAGADFPFLKRAYLHLWPERQLWLSVIDSAYPELDMLTPFQVTQQYGFACHKSQHWTWFKGWIYGKGRAVECAGDIDSYSPLEYGLYYLAEGCAEVQDDMFLELTSYEEQEKAEMERLEAERLEEARKAEEKAMEEKLEALEREKAARAKLRAAEICCAAGAVIAAAAAIVLIARRRGKKSKH